MLHRVLYLIECVSAQIYINEFKAISCFLYLIMQLFILSVHRSVSANLHSRLSLKVLLSGESKVWLRVRSRYS